MDEMMLIGYPHPKKKKKKKQNMKIDVMLNKIWKSKHWNAHFKFKINMENQFHKTWQFNELIYLVPYSVLSGAVF